MLHPLTVAVLVALTGFVHGVALQRPQDASPISNLIRSDREDAACLSKEVRQSASGFTGQEAGTTGIKSGQSPSEVDHENFINFCSGYPLTNGQQLSTSSCNGIPMGRIPAKTNMVSTIITSPQPGDKLVANKPFNITLQTRHLHAGFLVNPSVNYYTAPQELDPASGNVIGHCHITIQDIGSLRSMKAPDASQFAFFKGIDDAGDGNGGLQTSVPGGLPASAYRLCTMIAARNHQPVSMPVAQRGAQDDCTKFEVVADTSV